VANPVAIGVQPTVTADVTDGTGTGVKLVEYRVDGGTWMTTLPTFNVTGLHNIDVRGTDYALNIGDPVSTLLAVFDPNDGFVTGAAGYCLLLELMPLYCFDWKSNLRLCLKVYQR